MKNPNSTPLETLAFPIGIVGGGFGALLSYISLRFKGIPAADIRVFSATASPEETWSSFVRAIGQHHMRSESDGHFWPTTSPGLATVEAIKTWSIKPLVLSWFDLYHPSVEFMLEHVRRVAAVVGFWQSLVVCRISRVERGEESFRLYDENNQLCAVVRHLVVAIGHGQIRLPEPISAWLERMPAADTRVVHAFDTKEYPANQTVLVLGDGLTSATQWMNLFERGASVVAVSAAGFTFGQHLNTPRRYFSKRGFGSFQKRQPAERVAQLRDATKGTVPLYPAWKRAFKKMKASGRLREVTGSLMAIDTIPASQQLACTVRGLDGTLEKIIVDRVICATGFAPAATHPLWAQLIADYQLPTYEGFLVVGDDFTVSELSDPDSVVAVVGAAAAWALPCADSLVGMKIAARTIADRLAGEDSWAPAEVWDKTHRWLRLVSGRAI